MAGIALRKSRVVPETFLYLDKPRGRKEEFVELLLEKIPYNKDVGYAGYSSKPALKTFLIKSIFGQEQEKTWRNIRSEDIKGTIEQALNLCESVLTDERIMIFVFPTVDSFVIEKMKGVSGFAPWKNMILLNMYPTTGWKEALKAAVGHELAHALALNSNNRTTIQDDLVFEGIAEHFREHFIGGGNAEWVMSIPKEQARLILKEIKPDLARQNERLYRELFFGTGKYPLWSGYAIGYYIVESYLVGLKKKEWKDVLKTSPSKVLEDNPFLLS